MSIIITCFCFFLFLMLYHRKQFICYDYQTKISLTDHGIQSSTSHYRHVRTKLKQTTRSIKHIQSLSYYIQYKIPDTFVFNRIQIITMMDIMKVHFYVCFSLFMIYLYKLRILPKFENPKSNYHKENHGGLMCFDFVCSLGSRTWKKAERM